MSVSRWTQVPLLNILNFWASGLYDTQWLLHKSRVPCKRGLFQGREECVTCGFGSFFWILSVIQGDPTSASCKWLFFSRVRSHSIRNDVFVTWGQIRIFKLKLRSTLAAMPYIFCFLKDDYSLLTDFPKLRASSCGAKETLAREAPWAGPGTDSERAISLCLWFISARWLCTSHSWGVFSGETARGPLGRTAGLRAPKSLAASYGPGRLLRSGGHSVTQELRDLTAKPWGVTRRWVSYFSMCWIRIPLTLALYSLVGVFFWFWEEIAIKKQQILRDIWG